LIVLCVTAFVWGSFIVVIGEIKPASDQREYYSAAMRFAKGLGLTHPGGELYVHTHPPLYALFLGVVYRAGGGNVTARFVQLALALATLVMVFLTARPGRRSSRARRTSPRPSTPPNSSPRYCSRSSSYRRRTFCTRR
jgi:hypothetical protein